MATKAVRCGHIRRSAIRQRTTDNAATWNLEKWLPKFGTALRAAPRGNPMVRMIDAAPKCNPYFVTLVIYWYRHPNSTVADIGWEEARNVLPAIHNIPILARRVSAGFRRISSQTLPAQVARQLQELIATDKYLAAGGPRSSAQILSDIATQCERGADMVEHLQSLLKNQTSRKRNPRCDYEVLLSAHLLAALGRERAGSIGATLCDCADEAFNNTRGERFVRWNAIELSCSRYRKRCPRHYQYLENLAKRNLTDLAVPEEHRAVWEHLSPEDCQYIASTLRPLYEADRRRIDRRI